MNRRFAIILIACLGWHFITVAQTNFKQLIAARTDGVFKIDGVLDEAAWKAAPVATDFIELRPTPFLPEEESNRTEIYILYNNQGMYIGGYCHEKNKDSIATQLVGRDNFGNNDFIGVIFDTYYDKINGFEYFVTPLGEQMDAKQAPNSRGDGEDFSWNSVWLSASKLQNDGWSFEMFLPYSVLRFSKKDQQVWGMNIVRRRNKSGQQLFWNSIDPQKNGFLTQEGTLTIPDKITPPLRLSFTPYLSTYVNNYPYNTAGIKNTTYAVNGGMDIKYGINESFTLDATLIPDFGQTQSDNKVLNLSPFEVKYNENRNFFTEGTELFNKGDLFYSRRIGAEPLHLYDVHDQLSGTEYISNNPTETKLLNAIKLSGRTKRKLGIGIFNAITKPMSATITDSSGKIRQIETNPLTNYNILVLDQSLKNNSSVTFVNSNVIRSGKDYDANVTAGLFNLYDKKNQWNLLGNFYTSTIFSYKNITGYKYGAGFGKVSGQFNFSTMVQVVDDKFDPNDLGIQFFNNNISTTINASYSITKPYKWYNSWYNNLNISYDQLFKPRAYQSLAYNYFGKVNLKNLWGVEMFIFGKLKGNDFYEPRISGRVFKSPAYYNLGFSVNTNQSKKYIVEMGAFVGGGSLFNSREFYSELGQTIRFSNKFSIESNITYNPIFNGAGFAGIYNSLGTDTVLFGRRNRSTIENRLLLKYSFNNKMYITMRLRHYWSKVDNKEIYVLNNDGYLDKLPQGNMGLGQFIEANKNFNSNYNIFNIDMLYSWIFAPGSELNVVWKNGTNTNERYVVDNYFKNFNHSITGPQSNQVSVKILFYIDYLQLKKKK
jgi:hypothetical protein